MFGYWSKSFPLLYFFPFLAPVGSFNSAWPYPNLFPNPASNLQVALTLQVPILTLFLSLRSKSHLNSTLLLQEYNTGLRPDCITHYIKNSRKCKICHATFLVIFICAFFLCQICVAQIWMLSSLHLNVMLTKLLIGTFTLFKGKLFWTSYISI